jgi:hypothetical protein
VLAIIRACARQRSDFLLRLSDSGAAPVLTLCASLLANGASCSHWLPMNETAHSIALSRHVLATVQVPAAGTGVGYVPLPRMTRFSKVVQHQMFRNTAIENTFENPVVLPGEVLSPHTRRLSRRLFMRKWVSPSLPRRRPDTAAILPLSPMVSPPLGKRAGDPPRPSQARYVVS